MRLEKLIKGWVGEFKTNLTQTLFLDLKEYHIFNDILISASHGTTQIDHIIVSKYGLFVIETKNKDGWIYGKSDDDYWTQVFFNKKIRFQNPLNQNYLHTKSLSEKLRINHGYIFSIIKFCGNCEFKTKMPENVLKNNLAKYIKSKKRILLSEGQIQIICQQLSYIKGNTSIFDKGRHIRNLKKRISGSLS